MLGGFGGKNKDRSMRGGRKYSDCFEGGANSFCIPMFAYLNCEKN